VRKNDSSEASAGNESSETDDEDESDLEEEEEEKVMTRQRRLGIAKLKKSRGLKKKYEDGEEDEEGAAYVWKNISIVKGRIGYM